MLSFLDSFCSSGIVQCSSSVCVEPKTFLNDWRFTAFHFLTYVNSDGHFVGHLFPGMMVGCGYTDWRIPLVPTQVSMFSRTEPDNCDDDSDSEHYLCRLSMKVAECN